MVTHVMTMVKGIGYMVYDMGCGIMLFIYLIGEYTRYGR